MWVSNFCRSPAMQGIISTGTVLAGRYQIDRYLGGGAFGETYLAKDMLLPKNPPCAVKRLKPQTLNPDILRLFNQEAEVLNELGNNHDQIPRLFAHFQENQDFYLVEEFIDGHDLSEELTPGKCLSEAEVTGLLREILEVLSVVHQRGVIHRDIKPQNLMRRKKDGKIVLIDFGAVKDIGTSAVNYLGQVTSTVVIGTPGYMPTEQGNSNPKFSSDIYAVGMLGIQALTGIMPHELRKDARDEIIWRNQAQVSPKLAAVLDRMVRYDFRQRYNSATQALQVVRGLSVSAGLTGTLLSFIRTFTVSPSRAASNTSIFSSNTPHRKVFTGGIIFAAAAVF